MAKNYVKGSAKLIKGQFGDLINVSLNLEDLQRLPQYKGYVRLTLAPRKEIGQYGDTHYIYENDYVPANNGQTQQKTLEQKEDLPF